MPLPEFTRVAWASETARAVWEPRIQAVSAAWLDVELRAVAEGLRPAALVFDRPGVRDRMTALGLEWIPVTENRYAVGRGNALDTLAVAYAVQDDETIGELLGFPPCCRTFFDHVWNVELKRDTTLSMDVTGDDPIECNILGRWIGVRYVPHLPCAWSCAATVKNGRAFEALMPANERGWLKAILSWPVKYSALHGIAIVTFPVLKVVTNTDYTPAAVVIERDGTPPAEAPSGLGFPFTNTRAKNIITLASLRTDPREWTDNGFPSKASMDAAHAMILNAIPTGAGLEVVDLGCGNGALLDKIPAVLRVGVESDPARASRGRAAGRDVRSCRIQELAKKVPETFGLALISMRRLEEFTDAERAEFRAWLSERVADVLVYSYDAPMSARIVRASEV